MSMPGIDGIGAPAAAAWCDIDPHIQVIDAAIAAWYQPPPRGCDDARKRNHRAAPPNSRMPRSDGIDMPHDQSMATLATPVSACHPPLTRSPTGVAVTTR